MLSTQYTLITPDNRRDDETQRRWKIAAAQGFKGAGKKRLSTRMPFFQPSIGDREVEAAISVLQSPGSQRGARATNLKSVSRTFSAVELKPLRSIRHLRNSISQPKPEAYGSERRCMRWRREGMDA